MNNNILNKEQLQAIKYGEGPLLIIAGAGTGKTTAATERIKYLISEDLAKPAEILALTFTEKAAQEMEERIDKIMPYGYIQMWISTFHSFCDRILRTEAIHIGLNANYVLMTEADSLMFLRKYLFDFQLDYFRPAGNPNKFLHGLLVHFSRLKDEDISPKDYLRWINNLDKRQVTQRSQKDKDNAEINKEDIKKYYELANAYQKYEELKIKEGMMDFGDLITNTLKLFRKRSNVLAQYQKKFKYILVDEFQDTNISQNELVMLLAGKKANLTVVADDDQSIYRFRGSSISNVMQFRKTYPQAKIISLTKNYRSSQEILDKAYDLIQHNNPDRLEVREKINKKLTAIRSIEDQKIQFLMAQRVENEADLVAKEIREIIGQPRPEDDRPLAEAASLPGGDQGFQPPEFNNQQYQYKDIAILVRANNHADPFVRSLLRQGIPFQFLGPGRLFKQDEVKDLIAYLLVLYNFADDIAFFRVLSMPIFNLNARDIAGIRNYAKKFHLSFFEAAEQAEKILLTQKGQEDIKKIVQMIHKHLKLIPKDSAGQILYYFLEDTGLLKQMAEYKNTRDEEHAQNIAKFFDKLKTYEAEHQDASVLAVVDWLNLKMELGESPLASDNDWTQENKVNILTIHGAKGLEFPVVFLVNLVNDRFPTRERKEQISISDNLIKEILPTGDYHEQEERRLFYVGMTRARDLLYFSAAKFYGEGKRIKKISPFVYETLGKEIDKSINNQQLTINNQLSIFDFKPLREHPATSFQQPVIKINYISYSQIETFRRCPLEYKFHYILGIPQPVSAPASFGSSVHASLRDFYRQVLAKHRPTKDDLMQFLELNWQKEGYLSNAHEKRMLGRAQKMLADFYKRGYQQSDNPIALEQTFIIKPFFNLKVGGRMDRIDQLSSGKIEIIDYKTGKVPTQKAVDKDMQMSIYALAAVDRGIYHKKLDEVKLSFYFLENQQKITTTRTEENLNQTKEEILKVVKDIEQSDFLPHSGRHCDFCPYRLLCPS